MPGAQVWKAGAHSRQERRNPSAIFFFLPPFSLHPEVKMRKIGGRLCLTLGLFLDIVLHTHTPGLDSVCCTLLRSWCVYKIGTPGPAGVAFRLCRSCSAVQHYNHSRTFHSIFSFDFLSTFPCVFLCVCVVCLCVRKEFFKFAVARN